MWYTLNLHDDLCQLYLDTKIRLFSIKDRVGARGIFRCSVGVGGSWERATVLWVALRLQGGHSHLACYSQAVRVRMAILSPEEGECSLLNTLLGL